MPKRIVINNGDKFGRWTIINEEPYTKRSRWFKCKCDCGTVRTVRIGNLLYKDNPSCGCRRAEDIGDRTRTHGLSQTGSYKAWCNMRGRCLNPTDVSYANYGGRGITICPEWANFEVFLQDMGEHPGPEYSLDREDNDGPYSPDNCRWATTMEQHQNRRPQITIDAILKFTSLTRKDLEWVREQMIKEKEALARMIRGNK